LLTWRAMIGWKHKMELIAMSLYAWFVQAVI